MLKCIHGGFCVQENEAGAASWEERRRTEAKSYEKEVRRLREEIEVRRKAIEELQLEVRIVVVSSAGEKFVWLDERFARLVLEFEFFAFGGTDLLSK